MTQSQHETLQRLLNEPPILIALVVLVWRGCHQIAGSVTEIGDGLPVDGASIRFYSRRV